VSAIGDWQLLGRSTGICSLLADLERVLPNLGPGRRLPAILLQGETGTGKGLLARTIHQRSPRARGPFVDLNCAAIPATLLESELFGFERGAFTDARQARTGLVQAAHGGTLFLDEIGLLPEALQAKLLTVIESREIRPLGGTRPRPVDVLIVAATNADLQVAVRERRFREDLYHRLAVLVFSLPPLRDRGADVLELAEAFLARACADHGVDPKRLSDEACAAIEGYRWPGNVRELANLMDRAAMLTEGPVVAAADLDLPAASSAVGPGAAESGPPPSLKASVDGFTRARLEEALGQAGGNVSVAAEQLGVARSTLRYQLERFGLTPGREGRSRRPVRPLAERLLDRADPSAGTADRRALSLPDRPSIAVLAFDNLSSDPEQEYFADGIVEDMLTALSRLRWLFVIARQSSFSYKGRAVDLKRVGRELGVRYVVEGSVRKSGNRVRVAAQLIEAETGAHIWADRYERQLGEIFTLQDEITERIVAAVVPSITSVEITRARAKPTESLSAYDLYLRALPDYYGLGKEGNIRAEVSLRKAIELDPGYAEALGLLTDSITIRTMNGWHESVVRGRDDACEFARRALAAGPDNSTCIASAAFAYAALGRRFEEALELADRAIRLHPNSVFVRNRAGGVYVSCGESDKAISEYEAAHRMNPLHSRASTFTLTGLAAAHFFARRFEECVHWGRRALPTAPQPNLAHKLVAAALGHLGRIDDARVESAAVIDQDPTASVRRARLSSFRHEWMYELYLEGLRKAGFPEE
jgi:adenylate cyclase